MLKPWTVTLHMRGRPCFKCVLCTTNVNLPQSWSEPQYLRDKEAGS